jgi:hypothetical protein
MQHAKTYTLLEMKYKKIKFNNEWIVWYEDKLCFMPFTISVVLLLNL